MSDPNPTKKKRSPAKRSSPRNRFNVPLSARLTEDVRNLMKATESSKAKLVKMITGLLDDACGEGKLAELYLADMEQRLLPLASARKTPEPPPVVLSPLYLRMGKEGIEFDQGRNFPEAHLPMSNCFFCEKPLDADAVGDLQGWGGGDSGRAHRSCREEQVAKDPLRRERVGAAVAAMPNTDPALKVAESGATYRYEPETPALEISYRPIASGDAANPLIQEAIDAAVPNASADPAKRGALGDPQVSDLEALRARIQGPPPSITITPADLAPPGGLDEEPVR